MQPVFWIFLTPWNHTAGCSASWKTIRVPSRRRSAEFRWLHFSSIELTQLIHFSVVLLIHIFFTVSMQAPPPNYRPPTGASAHTWPNIYSNLKDIDFCVDQFDEITYAPPPTAHSQSLALPPRPLNGRVIPQSLCFTPRFSYSSITKSFPLI
jgi:hypothetical protein